MKFNPAGGTENRYYLKAMGSVCYDKTGITYPYSLPIDLQQFVKLYDVMEVKWEQQFGWTNQPDVLTFVSFRKSIVNTISEFGSYLGLIVVDYWEVS